MSSLGPKVLAVIVPCTLAACADKFTSQSYTPAVENEGVNSERYQYPQIQRHANTPQERVQPVWPQPKEARPSPNEVAVARAQVQSKTPPPNQVGGQASQAPEVEPPVERVATSRTETSSLPQRQSRIQRFEVTEPALIPEIDTRPRKPSEQYFAPPPQKPMAFRPGIKPGQSAQPLLWEKSKADSVMWSSYARQVIGDEAAESLLPGTDDIEEFCPRYNALENRDLRINFWAYLISAIAEVESGFDPADRMTEKGLGVDKVTKKQVVSEGLLQLSYQDSKWYPACEFDWEADRKLDQNDARKTILDPFKNLKCGISILANQVKNHRKISLDGYWSVLRPDGRKYSKVNQIKRRTKQLSFCS